MSCERNHPHGFRGAISRANTALGALARVAGAGALALAGNAPATLSGQQSTTVAAPLVFDGVTVIDVDQGKLVADQRVVITGNRIQAVGGSRGVSLPKGAQVVDAHGKYLIPGLWDMHVHVADHPQIYFPLLVANGVTGIRDMHQSIFPFDSVRKWRRETLAGSRVGPRIIGTGGFLTSVTTIDARVPLTNPVATAADAYRVVDSLKAIGVDFIKIRDIESREIFFAIAAAARRAGLPLAGHRPKSVTVEEASDSGQRALEHILSKNAAACVPDSTGAVGCRDLVARLIRNGTWLVPTLALFYDLGHPDRDRARYWPATVLNEADQGMNAMYRKAASGMADKVTKRDQLVLGEIRRFGTPILAGTDAIKEIWEATPGFSLHDELALLAGGGLTPLEALQAATLNPARFLGAADSLGTVARGKLADLVLLDADPLVDIHNTTKISGVVANGRYFDRAALDRLLAGVQAKANTKSTP